MKIHQVDMWIMANQYFEQVELQLKKTYGEEAKEIIKQSLIHFLKVVDSNNILLIQLEEQIVDNIIQPQEEEEVEEPFLEQEEEILPPPLPIYKSFIRPNESALNPQEFDKKIKEMNEGLIRKPLKEEIRPTDFDEEVEDEYDEPVVPKNFINRLKQIKKNDFSSKED